jgi:hypothetical protein
VLKLKQFTVGLLYTRPTLLGVILSTPDDVVPVVVATVRDTLEGHTVKWQGRSDTSYDTCSVTSSKPIPEAPCYLTAKHCSKSGSSVAIHTSRTLRSSFSTCLIIKRYPKRRDIAGRARTFVDHPRSTPPQGAWTQCSAFSSRPLRGGPQPGTLRRSWSVLARERLACAFRQQAQSGRGKLHDSCLAGSARVQNRNLAR